MRKIILPVLASLAIASPALANESRVEARGGVIWGGGNEEAIAGVAAGYDFDLAPGTFGGAEITADKILTSGSDRVSVGFNGRLGTNLGLGKLYAVGGYNTKFCDGCDGVWTAGAGYQHGFANLYGKVEYRHYFIDQSVDADAVTAGVGLRF